MKSMLQEEQSTRERVGARLLYSSTPGNFLGWAAAAADLHYYRQTSRVSRERIGGRRTDVEDLEDRGGFCRLKDRHGEKVVGKFPSYK